MKSKKITALLLAGSMLAVSVVCICPGKNLEVLASDSIVCDGSREDWSSIAGCGSGNDAVADWKVCVSDENLYLYVEQNPTGNYGEAVGNTQIGITYTDSSYFNSNYGTILFAQDWGSNGGYILKDGYYDNIAGSTVVFENGNTDYNVDSAFAEIQIPRSWFPSENFTFTYAGKTIDSSQIPVINGAKKLGASEEENTGYGDGNSSAAVEENTSEDTSETAGEEIPEGTNEKQYNGISIDGEFADWSMIQKTQNPDPVLKEGAAVWDGDAVYLYLREQDNWEGCAAMAGPYHNGNFCIELSDGTKTSVFIRNDRCYIQSGYDEIPLEFYYKDHEYEVKVPVAQLQGFKDSVTSISFGIMTDKTPRYITQGCVNLTPEIDYDNGTEGTLKKISYDYDFSDWDGYQKTTIQYSTAGHSSADAVGALYSDGDYLFGYVDYYGAFYNDPFNYITLCVNGAGKGGMSHMINFTLRAVDGNGNVNPWNQATGLGPGDYEYYLFDTAYVGGATNINNPYTFSYGRAYIHVDKTGKAQMEYYIDIPTLVKVVNLKPEQWGAYDWNIKQTDIKTFHVNYIRIGSQWVSCGGTSTGPVIGILLCMAVVVLAQVYRKKRTGKLA